MFRIVNTRSGVDLGVFTGASEAEALDRFAREAGYASYAEIPEEVRSSQGEILVLRVRYQLFVDGDQFGDWIDASGPEEALRVLRDAVLRGDHDDAAKPRRLCIEVHNEAGQQVAVDWVVIGSEARPLSPLAQAFSLLLRGVLDVDEMEQVIELNRTAPPGVCHSHDYLDANELMNEAFRQVFGRYCDPSMDADGEQWDAAWDEAKAAEFPLVQVGD